MSCACHPGAPDTSDQDKAYLIQIICALRQEDEEDQEDAVCVTAFGLPSV